ncbi:hypothetical protein DFP72DRAFT_743759, partial [Ephemerocybe angulata]
LEWSRRKATQAAQKLPDDWEEQCVRSCMRKSYVIREHDIVPELFINSDQTQVVYAPGDKMTYDKKGEKQVRVIGLEEKRAFTVVVSVASDGSVLPFQAIYKGSSKNSLPSPEAPNYNDLIGTGTRLVSSRSGTYWSNQGTMRELVEDIIEPYISRIKAKLKLPEWAKCLWTIDVFSVHRSEEFRGYMKTNHPNIVLDFVPGGCT